MNSTPPITGGVIDVYPTQPFSYEFTASVGTTGYQYAGSIPNTSFFGSNLTSTGIPGIGAYPFIVDGIQPNATITYPFTSNQSTTFVDFPNGAVRVGNDVYYNNTFADRIVKLTNGVGPPANWVGIGRAATLSNIASGGTGLSVYISRPWGMYYESSTNSLIVSGGGRAFYRINVSTAFATIFAGSASSGFSNATGTAARFNGSLGIDYDNSGNIYTADQNNQRIRRITPAAVVTTYAGSGTLGYLDSSSALTAQFNSPSGIAVNRITGDVYVADRFNHCIRKITPSGVVSTFAGSNISGYVDDVGTAARFSNIFSLVFRDADQCLYASANNRVRKITMSGVVTTFAGNGTSTLDPGINLATGCPAGYFTVDASNDLIISVNGTGRGGYGKIAFPTPEVRPGGSRPVDYTITATTGTVNVNVLNPISVVTATPPIVNGIATLYKFSPFQYTLSNLQVGQSFTVTAPTELAAFVSISGSTASFSSTAGFQTSYSSVFPISFNALSGSNVVETFSFNVQVLPGRFFPPAAGASNTFHLNETIAPILFQADVSLTQIYSSPTIPPGLSFTQLDVSGFQYQLQGTPTVQSTPTTYNIIGRNTQTGRIVSVSNTYRVDSERIVLSVAPSSNVSNMLVGTAITPRTVTGLYPTYGTYSYQYRWTQVLPPGLELQDAGGAPVVSGFSPTDLSSTIRIAGIPTLAAAQLFRTNNITSYPFTLTANQTRGTSTINASIPFTFSFDPTVLFTQESSNATLYLNDVIDSNDGFVFQAGTFFTTGTVNISSIFSPNLRSDLSLQFIPGSPLSTAYLVSPTGATFSETNQPYVIRAINTNGLVRNTVVFITTQPDIAAFTPPTDLCSTFIFSRPLANAKTGYYNSPINFRATATSGRTITYSDGGTLAGTGLSLSNIVSNNSVRLVGTPITTQSLSNLTITAIAAETFATATTSVQFSIVPDSASWVVTPTLPNPLEVIQNVESTPYQFRATTLSGLQIAYYSSTNVPVGMNLSSTARLTGTPTIPGSGTASVIANTGYSALSLSVPYTVLPDEILFVTPSNLYQIVPGQLIPSIPITAFSYSGIFGSNFTLDPSGNPTYGVSITSGGTIYGTAVQQIPPTLLYPAVPIPLYVSAVAGTVSGTFSFLLGTNNPGLTPDPYLYFSNQTGPAFPSQDSEYTLYQYGNTSITVLPPPYPGLEFPYLYIHPTDLPAGLRFDGLTGVISGYPTELVFERAVTVHALQRTSKLVSSFELKITVLNPFVVRPQTSAAAYTSLLRQYTLANASQNSRDYRVFAGAERTQGAFAAGEGADVTTQIITGCDPNCPQVIVPTVAFNPLDLEGCNLWLDAFDPPVILKGAVSEWNDKSGSGNHANQIVGNPVYDISAINGYPGVTLDVCASMYGSLSNTGVYATAFVVFNSQPSVLLDPSFAYHPILSTGRADGSADVTLMANTGAFIAYGDITILTERSGTVTPVAVATFGSLVTASLYDGTLQRIGRGGIVGQQTEVSTGNFAYVRYGLGNNAGTPTLLTLPWAGSLGEILVYHSILPDSDRQKVEGYLSWKWGLEGNLPGSHPYKNAPP